MNLLVSGLIGYALKEVVVPLVNEHIEDKKSEEKQIPEKEIENALFASNDLIKMVSNIIDVVV